jgi:hypothetical protein
MTNDLHKITAAVNYLVASPSYAKLVNEMAGIIDRWDTHPMVYGPKLEHLNSLIGVGLQSRDTFDELIKLAARKRRDLPQARRQDYQRELMRARRGRVAKAVALREALFGRMTKFKRDEYAKDVQLRWAEERSKFLKERGQLSWHQRNEAIAAFWETIDRNLDQNLAEAKRGRLTN